MRRLTTVDDLLECWWFSQEMIASGAPSCCSEQKKTPLKSPKNMFTHHQHFEIIIQLQFPWLPFEISSPNFWSRLSVCENEMKKEKNAGMIFIFLLFSARWHERGGTTGWVEIAQYSRIMSVSNEVSLKLGCKTMINLDIFSFKKIECFCNIRFEACRAKPTLHTQTQCCSTN